MPGGAPDPLMRQHGLIGAPISRVDGPLKVEGKARFAAEVPLDGLVYAALFYSSIARGRIVRIGTAAEAAPGVVLVVTYKNAPRMKPPALFGTSPSAAAQCSLPIMQDASIHWNGEVLAVVRRHAGAGRPCRLPDRCRLRRRAGGHVVRARQGQVAPPASILGEPSELAIGDAEAALAGAAVVVDRTYRTPRHTHNTIELHAATIAWEGDRLTIHDASQLVNATASTIAGVFGLKDEQVRVIPPYVGGSFGGKCRWDHQILAAAASKLAGRPVRIILSREAAAARIRLTADGHATVSSAMHEMGMGTATVQAQHVAEGSGCGSIR